MKISTCKVIWIPNPPWPLDPALISIETSMLIEILMWNYEVKLKVEKEKEEAED